MSFEPNKPLLNTLDDAEPKADRAPVPILLIGLFALIAFLGMLYLADHGGEFDRQVYPPYTSTNQLAELQVKDEVAIFKAHGEKIYQTCSACHQPNGAGSAAVNAPPLAGSEWVDAEGPNRVIRIVLNGLKGPVTVKGQAFGAGVMAHWRDVYSDEDLAAVLTFIRGNPAWGNNASAVTPEQVKALRDKTKDRPLEQSYTSDELLKIPDKD